MDKANTISIVVPIYMVENELDRCVKSLVGQTHRDLEILLVDDGSKDRCPQMCDEYASLDSRIRVIHKSNGGLSDARNAGLREAEGDFVLYVDSDDYLELDACERLLGAMRDEADLVVGACRELRADGVDYQRHSNIPEGVLLTAREYVIASIQANEWYAPAWLNLYRRDFLLRNDLYFRKGFVFEDTEMLPRLFLAAEKLVYIDYPFYNYVIRANSIMTAKASPEKQNMAIEIYSGWLERFRQVEDSEYQRYLYGILIRSYVSTARRLGIEGWRVRGLDRRFGMKYALGSKERVKVAAFSAAPKLYCRV